MSGIWFCPLDIHLGFQRVGLVPEDLVSVLESVPVGVFLHRVGLVTEHLIPVP